MLKFVKMTDILFTKPCSEDLIQLKALWTDVFEENPKAVSLIFDSFFDIFDGYCAKKGDKIVAALYLIKGNLNGEKAHYLCGAATLPEYRNQGIMSKLIEYALSDAAQSGDKYSLLLPANNGLYNFYSNLGYVPSCSVKKRLFSRSELEACAADSKDKKLTAGIGFEQLQKLCFADNFLAYNSRFLSFAGEYYKAYGVTFLQNERTVAIVDCNDDCTDVIYSAYADFGELADVLLKNINTEHFAFWGKADNPLLAESEKQKYGMIKLLDNNFKISEDIYIGITLS